MLMSNLKVKKHLINLFFIVKTNTVLSAKTQLHGLNKQVREGEGLGL